MRAQSAARTHKHHPPSEISLAETSEANARAQANNVKVCILVEFVCAERKSCGKVWSQWKNTVLWPWIAHKHLYIHSSNTSLRAHFRRYRCTYMRCTNRYTVHSACVGGELGMFACVSVNLSLTSTAQYRTARTLRVRWVVCYYAMLLQLCIIAMPFIAIAPLQSPTIHDIVFSTIQVECKCKAKSQPTKTARVWPQVKTHVHRCAQFPWSFVKAAAQVCWWLVSHIRRCSGAVLNTLASSDGKFWTLFGDLFLCRCRLLQTCRRLHVSREHLFFSLIFFICVYTCCFSHFLYSIVYIVAWIRCFRRL